MPFVRDVTGNEVELALQSDVDTLRSMLVNQRVPSQSVPVPPISVPESVAVAVGFTEVAAPTYEFVPADEPALATGIGLPYNEPTEIEPTEMAAEGV